MKASIVAASVALAGSVAASAHNAHAGLHRRDYGHVEDVCTIYKTVYVTASPSVAYPAAVPSTSCTDDKTVPTYTPAKPYSTEVVTKPAPKPSEEAYPSAPPAPKPSKEAYSAAPPAPKPSKEAYSAAPPAPKPSSEAYSAAPPAPKPSKAVYSAAPPAPVVSKVAYKPSPVPSSSKVVAKPKPSGSYYDTGRIVTKGDKWAITYTPYANSGECKTAADIKADIKKIADLGFTTIRSYSTDCGVFESVVPACQEHGLKVIYGIFLEGAGKGTFSDHAKSQLDDIKNKAPKDSVAMVIVGNECIFNGNCEAADLASYIDHVREELRSCGFPKDIAVTTTEPVGTWEANGAALCDHIDVFTVQVHPYFTQSVTAEQAGAFAAQQLEQAAKVCPTAAAKGKYITEIGWPSAGKANGLAVAGVAEQKVAMKTIMESVGAESCVFSFQNDGWKAPGNLDVEQNFGCIDALAY